MPSGPEPPRDAPPVKAGRCRRAVVVFLAVAVGVLAADLVIKTLAFRHVAGRPIDAATVHESELVHEPITVVPGVLSLKLMLNRGAAFGLGQGGRWLFVLIGAVALAIIVSVFWNSSPRAVVTHVALALLLAGALGNLYDRVHLGRVRDMFWLFPGVRLPFELTWPGGSDQLYPWIFNLADASLCVGLAALLLLAVLGGRQADDAGAAPGSGPASGPVS